MMFVGIFCVMEICARQKNFWKIGFKWLERVLILIKTISIAIKKSNKAEVTDNQSLSGNTWSLMIKTRKWGLVNFEGRTSNSPKLARAQQRNPRSKRLWTKNSNNRGVKSVGADENQ
jgi:hypothetical protein